MLEVTEQRPINNEYANSLTSKLLLVALMINLFPIAQFNNAQCHYLASVKCLDWKHFAPPLSYIVLRI